MNYQQGYEDGVRATKAEYLKLLEEESHPVKKLTDEEMLELENALKVCDYKYFGSCEFSEKQWEAFEVLEKHARAILRKVQEKCNHSNFVKTEHLTGEGAMEYVEWFDNVCSDCGEHWTTNN